MTEREVKSEVAGMKQSPYKDQIFVHRKTGRRIKVLNTPDEYIRDDYMAYKSACVDLLYLDQNGPIRHGRKLSEHFDRDYVKETVE